MGDIEIKERIDITAGIIHQNIINDIQIFTATVQPKKISRSLHWVPGQCQVLTGALSWSRGLMVHFAKKMGNISTVWVLEPSIDNRYLSHEN